MINKGDLYTHFVKSGRYQVLDIVTPAGQAARANGKAVVYQDVRTGERYYRFIDDFMVSMSKIEEGHVLPE